MQDKEDEFFIEKTIVLELDGGETLRLFMRPLKVKEIPLTCRVSKMQQERLSEAEQLPHLIQLVQETIDTNIEGLPFSVLDHLVGVLFDFNFSDESNKKPKKRSVPAPSELAIAFDFLICQGHTFTDILEYTLPQVRLFQTVAAERIQGIKRVDPETGLLGTGVVWGQKR